MKHYGIKTVPVGNFVEEGIQALKRHDRMLNKAREWLDEFYCACQIHTFGDSVLIVPHRKYVPTMGKFTIGSWSFMLLNARTRQERYLRDSDNTIADVMLAYDAPELAKHSVECIKHYRTIILHDFSEILINHYHEANSWEEELTLRIASLMSMFELIENTDHGKMDAIAEYECSEQAFEDYQRSISLLEQISDWLDMNKED